MLLLLYTTFSVPYALAFGGNATNIQARSVDVADCTPHARRESAM
jgi:hypothetical protein